MKRWVFVWNSHCGLPPQVVAALEDLRVKHPISKIDHIGPAGLWDIVKTYPLADRMALLGAVPDLNDAPVTTAAEIQVLMKHLGSHAFLPSDTTTLDLTAVAEKLQRNNLSASVAATVRPAMPVAKLVREFVTSMPNPSFSQAIAADLAAKYVQLAASIDEPDVIFSNLVEYVSGTHSLDLKFFWAAAGIVTHYFELCDVFEL